MSRLSLRIAFLVTALALLSPASRASARTNVSIDLHIGDAYRGPRLVFQREPDVVIVPGTRVYYVRDYDYDLYRYGSFWYYNYDGGWYRARRYSGPFTYVGYRSIPSAVTYVPTRYRRHWRDAGEGHGYGRDEGRWHDNGQGQDNGG